MKRKYFTLIFTLFFICQISTYSQNRIFSRVFYSSPELHNSQTSFYSSQFSSYSIIIKNPIDNRTDFYNEKIYKRIIVQEYPDYWKSPLVNSIRQKIFSDFKNSNVFFFDKRKNVRTIEIQPIIEIFYPDVRGFIFLKSFAKVRIKMCVKLNNKEIINKKYDSFYKTRGHDKEWEGKRIDTIENGANITIGICLRKALDKFYQDLDITLKKLSQQ